jgi:hypothetical protein
MRGRGRRSLIKIEPLARSFKVEPSVIIDYLGRLGLKPYEVYTRALQNEIPERLREVFRAQARRGDCQASSQTGKIRINELARELEVKSNLILECLVGMGVYEKLSFTSVLDDELVNRVREYFGLGDETGGRGAGVWIHGLGCELVVNCNAILDYLVELGIPGRRSCWSTIDHKLANRVREHFRTGVQKGGGGANSEAGKIRINELAREVGVKSNLVLEYLPELGIDRKMSHSRVLDDELADKVREHFRAGDQRKGGGASTQAGNIPAIDPAKHEMKIDLPPLTRSIEEIKAAARKARR